MNFISVFSALAAFASYAAVNALTITNPTVGQNFGIGGPFDILVVNDEGESYTTASLTIASPFGSLVRTIFVGSIQTVITPPDVYGEASIVAVSGPATSNTVQVLITPALTNFVPANVGCRQQNPCQRRRRGCGYYADSEAEDVTEFAPLEQQEQQEILIEQVQQ